MTPTVSLVIATLAALLRLDPKPADPAEPQEAYVERTAVVALAAVEASPDLPTIATLVELAHRESHLDRRIHSGEGHPSDHEDHGRARCLLQVHRNDWLPGDAWDVLAGTDLDATRRCFAFGVRLLRARTCGVGLQTPAGAALTFAAYGVGHCVSAPSWALERARERERILRRLREDAEPMGRRRSRRKI